MIVGTTEQFACTFRVYWEDTDGGGVVYYANYLKFMERARTEWLRSLGFEQRTLREQYGILLVVARVEANFRRSARLDDLLQVTCSVIESGRASVIFEQNIYRGTAREALLLDGVTRVGCINAETFRPTALPVVVTAALQRQEHP